MRRDSATVVVPVGELPETLLDNLGHSPNVGLVRPPDASDGGLDAAVTALGEAAHRSSAYLLVPADPLAELAASWREMWDVAAGPPGSAGFEQRAAELLSAWRARRFELPDYYLVLAGPAAAPDLHLGPLRAVRPHRVVVLGPAEPAEQAARVRQALGSLPHGPWWPPLDELVDAARRFYAGGLAEQPASLATG
jgi:hypothetical protein